MICAIEKSERGGEPACEALKRVPVEHGHALGMIAG